MWCAAAAPKQLPRLLLEVQDLVLEHLGGPRECLVGPRVEVLHEVRHELVTDAVAAVPDDDASGHLRHTDDDGMDVGMNCWYVGMG